MSESHPSGSEQRFVWHPSYQGRTVAEVRDELRLELQRDQRAYGLAMEGAEEHEQQVLATIIDLDRRWSGYDFGWFEADAAALAERIATFEWEREQRRELFPFADLRQAQASAPVTEAASPRPWWAFWRR